MKIRPLGAELFHVDIGRTDGRTNRHDEASSCYSQFWRKRLKTYWGDSTYMHNFRQCFFTQNTTVMFHLAQLQT